MTPLLAAEILTDGVVQITLGALSLLGLITVGWWQFGRTTKTVKRTQETIGEKSDDMTVVEMLEEVLKGQAKQDNRLAAHDALHAAHDRRFEAHGRKLAEHEEAIRQLQGGDL